MQKHVNLVDLVKSFPTNIYLQHLASIQKRTSPVKFAHLAEKSGNGSISNLSTKVQEPPAEPCQIIIADEYVVCECRPVLVSYLSFLVGGVTESNSFPPVLLTASAVCL